LGNFDDDVDISRVWESIRGNIKGFSHRGHYELKHHKPGTDEEF
jgi:hypothetical protein